LLFFTDLMLHHNQLEFVWPRTFVGLRSLRRLTLAGNRLTSLPEAMLRHSTALRYLDLADNNCRSLRCPVPKLKRHQTTTSGCCFFREHFVRDRVTSNFDVLTLKSCHICNSRPG